MQLKRKRSESELSTSTASPFSSPSRPDAISPSTATPMEIDTFDFTPNFPVSTLFRFSNQGLLFPHVPGRTMKRLRDNRPSQHEVHQHTLHMLYAAQRQQPEAPAHKQPAAEQQQQQHTPVAARPGLAPSSHQANLHSFWNLPSCPSASPAECLLPTVIDTPKECEDCGQNLLGADDSMMMDVDDTSDSGGTSCRGCGKHVCSHCSITNLGEQRRCLGCAGTASMTRVGSGAATIPWAQGMSSWLR
ncbi:hypothetical protein F4861DRAFT_525812 [Xylaria intraflava]|nr:hypothetical protein F4861DRAFT_525812 [Xylaria intraflava]